MRDENRGSYRPVRRFGADPRRDLEAEIEFHLDAATRDLIATGLSPATAREEALRRFGDPEAARGACLAVARRRRRGERLRDIGDDLCYALRSLGRSRGFTAAALLTLALGIGAAGGGPGVGDRRRPRVRAAARGVALRRRARRSGHPRRGRRLRAAARPRRRAPARPKGGPGRALDRPAPAVDRRPPASPQSRRSG